MPTTLSWSALSTGRESSEMVQCRAYGTSGCLPCTCTLSQSARTAVIYWYSRSVCLHWNWRKRTIKLLKDFFFKSNKFLKSEWRYWKRGAQNTGKTGWGGTVNEVSFMSYTTSPQNPVFTPPPLPKHTHTHTNSDDLLLFLSHPMQPVSVVFMNKNV